LLQIPRLGERTGPIGADDATRLVRNPQVVAQARADGASDVFDDGDFFARDEFLPWEREEISARPALDR